MKITMYELFGLIKDGKAPKKIKFRNEIYEYENHIKDSFIDYVGIEKETNEVFYLSSYIGNNYISDIFTDEVEIIEEDKEFEDIREIRGEVERDKTLSHDENQDSIVKNFNMLIKWVNLLVRNQKRIINEINKLKGEK